MTGNKHAARIAGDDYQHLYSWWLILGLKLPEERIAKVILEDGSARYVDDVTIRYEPGTELPDRFYQIKYHVDQRNEYSAQELISTKSSSQSLLEKFWESWQHLRQNNPDRSLELYLVSNWTWGQDALGKWVGGATDSINIDEFFAAQPSKKIQNIKQAWQTKIQADDQSFKAFLSCLHFRLGYSASVLINEQVVERMRHLQLKTDIASLSNCSSIVRSWLNSNHTTITAEELHTELKRYNLYLPAKEERCVTIYMNSIEEQKYAHKPDYHLRWRNYFVDVGNRGGHQLKEPSNWNDILLPQLERLKNKVNKDTDCRFIRAYGQSRLSCWFAFGFTFSEVASYTLEVHQNNQSWRTDVEASKNVHLIITSNHGSPHGEILDQEGDTVALGISAYGSIPLDNDVKKYLAQRKGKIAALLLLSTEDLNRKIEDAHTVVAIAEQVKSYAKSLIQHWEAKKLLLFYQGPYSGACFIGHKLNAIHAEIQIMEDQQPGYAPSFLLK
ncbi:SAVED domain-containing protein [Dictyobacter aurantiacus]|uniref:SMODS-associated and fused to various effectors domain-containing protein n=1 Tax=Dictyobacter aurantiacus TaxID=1936993 RepID=A0A401ZQZ9_9CHLR|nr:SAVED domain-containing protein [Dictyobacter aurantiacus]GCE09291.1 hypothetical protein KDAU_66200 [Dictyobacter aurantiacus]